MLERILQGILDKMVSEKLFNIGRELDELAKETNLNMSDSESEELRMLFSKMGRISCEKFFTKLEERRIKNKKN